jgi:hypothetical protein
VREFGLTQAEATQAFKSWDLDRSAGIEYDEFEKMLGAVVQLKLKQQEAAEKAMEEVFGAAFGQKDMDNIDESAMEKKMEGYGQLLTFGCCCCLCTACLSWCPFYCKMRSIAQKAKKPLAEANMTADGQARARPSPRAAARRATRFSRRARRRRPRRSRCACSRARRRRRSSAREWAGHDTGGSEHCGPAHNTAPVVPRRAVCIQSRIACCNGRSRC